jgi:ATP-dependent protease HslVU (ClpYQ) ATPase subunit
VPVAWFVCPERVNSGDAATEVEHRSKMQILLARWLQKKKLKQRLRVRDNGEPKVEDEAHTLVNSELLCAAVAPEAVIITNNCRR